ncbi:MAG TPA: caspase family protein [Pyrinomonadaceae bacterium]|nr:caspase family protein [Pyrinomonadaceae bacterium]
MPALIPRLCLLAAILATTPLAASTLDSLRLQNPDGGAVRSLIIGIDAYQHVRQLKGAVADALDIEKSLRSMGIGDVTTLINAGASRENIMQAIKDLVQRTGPNDLIVLSIAGHGAQEPETVKGSEPDGIENVFLLPGFELTARGSKQRILGSEFNHFIRQFESRGAKVLFVADTCHGGGLAREIDPRAEEMSFRQVPTYTLLVDMLKPVTDDQESVTDLDLDKTTFLAAVDRNTKAPEIRIPGIDGFRGALSYAVARAFEGSADDNHDGKVTLKELFANVRQVVYQLSDQRQNIVTKTSPGRPIDRDVVYQLTRGITSPGDIKILPKLGLQAPSDAQDSPAVPRAQAPIRLAALDGRTGYFANLKPRDVMIEIVRPVDNPDLIWDPNSHDVIAWGDVVAYNVDSTDLASVIDRTAAVRELKKISAKAPQLLRLTAGDEQHHNDDMVQVELSDVAQRSIVLVNVSGDGTIQLLYPLGTDQNTASSFQISLRVREPFGADQVIAVTSTDRLPELEQVVSELNRRRAPGALIKSMMRYMPADVRVGSIGIFTAP